MINVYTQASSSTCTNTQGTCGTVRANNNHCHDNFDIGDLPKGLPSVANTAWIDQLPIPGFMKNLFKNLMNRQCDAEAAKTINDFQKCELNGARITTAQMEQMATTGKITKNDGTTVCVPIDVQQSAQRFMADGGRLFKTMESATDGKHDGQLGVGDYRQALRKDRIDDDLF